MTTTRPGNIHLTFEGTPVAEGLGVDPNFIGKAIPAFTDLVDALCEEPDGETTENQTLPILLTRLNMGSCTLHIQEQDLLTPHGMSRFHEVINSFAEEEEDDTADVLNSITDQSFNCLKQFLTVNASAETTFTVDHNDEATGMQEADDIKNALKLLRRMRKLEIKEDDVKVKFVGYLPNQKKTEFTRKDSGQIETARISPKARGFDDLIQRIDEDRVVSLVTRVRSGGRPSMTVLTIQ